MCGRGSGPPLTTQAGEGFANSRSGSVVFFYYHTNFYVHTGIE
jgi:hypothetical protein